MTPYMLPMVARAETVGTISLRCAQPWVFEGGGNITPQFTP
jgi:hypothetical protein